MTFDRAWHEARRTKDTLAWLEFSGPLYVDMELVVVQVRPEGVRVYLREDKPEDGWLLDQRHVSFAGWRMLQQAKPGDIVDVKCRCDEVASNL